MLFEGNEIERLNKRKVTEEELKLLSVDENLNEFERALILM